MEQIKNSPPEASTDERASSLNPQPEAEAPESEALAASDWPEFATREEANAFWQGVKRGIRESGRDRAHPHMPEREGAKTGPSRHPGESQDLPAFLSVITSSMIKTREIPACAGMTRLARTLRVFASLRETKRR